MYVLRWAFVGFMLGVCWAHVGSIFHVSRIGPVLGHEFGNLAHLRGFEVPLKRAEKQRVLDF